MMHANATGAAAKPFMTHHNALDMDLFMRIAPELHLKRLLVGGLERVYEINRNFRNEGIDTQHNPEFTMIEFYQAYATYEDLMKLTEELLRGLCQEVCGATTIKYQEVELDFGSPFKRLTVEEAGKKYVDELLESNRIAEKGEDGSAEFLAAVKDTIKVHLSDRGTGNEIFKKLDSCKAWLEAARELLAEADFKDLGLHLRYIAFEHFVEPTLIQPTFVYRFPIAVSPLARRNDKEPWIADRFELFVNGREIANAFSELNDPDDQALRFLDQLKAKARGDEEAMDFDADYIRALQYGMPPAAGEGIGIDRLAMLLTDAPSIRDVILFPLLKKEQTTAGGESEAAKEESE
jgi:lysyl-tRNA synthetase class 2